MLKYCDILLLINILSCLIVVSGSLNLMATKKIEQSNILNQILVLLIRKCDLGIKNTVVIDRTNRPSTFEAVSSESQPLMSVSLLSNLSIIRYRQIYNEIVQVDGLILVINRYDDLSRLELYLVNKWLYKRNCMIFILAKPYFECLQEQIILKSFMRLYLPAIHYICLNELHQPIIFTLNPYGDTKPRSWINDGGVQFAGRNGTQYYRFVDKDSTEICKEFYFERKHPKNKTYLVLGIASKYILKKFGLKKKQIYDEEIEPYFDSSIRERIKQLKKLLEAKLLYQIKRITDSDFIHDTYANSSIDAILFVDILVNYELGWHYFHPLIYEDFSILSRNRGLKTPLEKIISYYGYWTLTSLMLISTIVFIVVWLKTNKSLYSAAFDVLRLLINSGVVIPINNFSLKILFCMIFLYFLIIHATFSGHLAEFLTKVKLRENIETLEDLKDSRIKTIYNFGFRYENIDDAKSLSDKTVLVEILDHCLSSVQSTSNSVCIGYASKFRRFRVFQKDWKNTFYISEKVLHSSTSAYLYRPGYPLSEKMNWIMMSLSETKVFNRFRDQKLTQDIISLEKHMKISYIYFRSITINDLRFAFIFLLIGNSLGLICFFCELFINWYLKKYKKIETMTKIIVCERDISNV